MNKKNVLITGASRGIGKAIALLLPRRDFVSLVLYTFRFGFGKGKSRN